jgi:tRNA (Thr-GGU) A37 N-methylase
MVGVGHSQIGSQREMPSFGVDGEIEIFPSYAESLEGIDGHSNLFVLGWIHRANRTVKKAVPRKISPDLPEKGVFAIRSPSRPNPVSLTVVKLNGVREVRILEVSSSI